jgi:hypothetical protein
VAKHVNAEKDKNSQRAKQSADRKAKQAERGSKVFKKGNQVHNGASLGQSGQPRTR